MPRYSLKYLMFFSLLFGLVWNFTDLWLGRAAPGALNCQSKTSCIGKPQSLEAGKGAYMSGLLTIHGEETSPKKDKPFTIFPNISLLYVPRCTLTD